MKTCPFYKEKLKGCELQREWGLCTEKAKDQYTYHWEQCGWYIQEKEKEELVA